MPCSNALHVVLACCAACFAGSVRTSNPVGERSVNVDLSSASVGIPLVTVTHKFSGKLLSQRQRASALDQLDTDAVHITTRGATRNQDGVVSTGHAHVTQHDAEPMRPTSWQSRTAVRRTNGAHARIGATHTPLPTYFIPKFVLVRVYSSLGLDDVERRVTIRAAL